MKSLRNYITVAGVLFATSIGFAQDDMKDKEEMVDEPAQEQSNIQQYTPSKLIGKGQVDLKWFNNLYTQTKSTFSEGDEPRQTFFTSTFEFYTGVGQNKRVNLGLIARVRSNVIADRGALDVFSFDGETGTARSGLTAIAPSIKFVPFPSVSNFSIQSSVFIPLIDNESEDFLPINNGNGVFLEQNGFVWQNRLFYDYTFPGNKWQLFTELTTELNLGDGEKSFANNSLNINPGVFLSYFPSSKFTVLALAQHSSRVDLGNNFGQNFTAVGGGAKYQLTKALNLELLYTNFVRGNNTGLGQTFNLGLRGIF
ncbi:hypothetical protein FEE95_08530 [Maribacter algarum]|uniref:MetA-pathway of phenol degradation n=1 Tax=Maribacter algarum (ex Zhang et al. 2020) TaxID=2578118 RepID=A0A5S3PWP7_9FLAO|nr:hypothetical protein [Maribacter algarum]TMM59456.1 hypothetical protein FEE95_08530 [Maribacter algarum]